MSEIKKKKITIPTYRVGEPEPLPLYFESTEYRLPWDYFGTMVHVGYYKY